MRVPVPPLRTIDRPASPEPLFQPRWVGAESALTRLLTYNSQAIYTLLPFFTQRL